jgi:hypothetical protein
LRMRRRILPFRKRSWRSKGSKVVLMSIIKMILKNPSCIVDPCVALACDTATSECSSISDTEAVCSCLSGFSAVIGETNVCEDVDECSEGTHNCPTVTTACVNNDGSFECGKPILWLFYTASDIFNMCVWPRVAREQRAATFPELSLLARKPKSASSARKC